MYLNYCNIDTKNIIDVSSKGLQFECCTIFNDAHQEGFAGFAAMLMKILYFLGLDLPFAIYDYYIYLEVNYEIEGNYSNVDFTKFHYVV